MLAERRAEYDAFEARRRLEREAKDEEQMSNCYGKFSWKCTVCGTPHFTTNAKEPQRRMTEATSKDRAERSRVKASAA